MNRLVEKDKAMFERAVTKLGGIAGGREPVALLTDRYEDSLDSKLTAAEIGITEKEFINKLKNHELLKSIGLNTLVAGGTIARETWEEIFPTVVDSVGAGDPRFDKDQYKNEVATAFKAFMNANNSGVEKIKEFDRLIEQSGCQKLSVRR